ncbi:MAG TPA: hypothetical protein VHH12_06585 [Mycobacterium sp.]|nr:hypothetical protein [Mycobacterium sp.]
MMGEPNVTVLADHPVWLAVPAFAPAIVVAAVVVYIAVKNRRKGGGTTQSSDAPTEDGKP